MRRTCGWPVSEVSGSADPSPARRREIGLPGVSSPTAPSSTEDPAHPGGSTPRHRPPSGFDYPPDGLRPSEPGDGPSAAAALLGFALQGLAPPGQRYPSRGLASPVVSSTPGAPGMAATPEVDSGGEGARLASGRSRRRPNLALVGFSPSKAFSSVTFGPASRSEPLLPFRPAVLPTVSTAGRGSRGLRVTEAAGLSRDCRPSWGFAPLRKR
jgi:hypothetical protein